MANTKPFVAFVTEPHAEHKVVLVEDAATMDDAIFEVVNHAGTHVGFTGAELTSLAEWWMRMLALPDPPSWCTCC